jgi:hypothetical protein
MLVFVFRGSLTLLAFSGGAPVVLSTGSSRIVLALGSLGLNPAETPTEKVSG